MRRGHGLLALRGLIVGALEVGERGRRAWGFVTAPVKNLQRGHGQQGAVVSFRLSVQQQEEIIAGVLLPFVFLCVTVTEQ
jgi:hypothetical protein